MLVHYFYTSRQHVTRLQLAILKQFVFSSNLIFKAISTLEKVIFSFILINVWKREPVSLKKLPFIYFSVAPVARRAAKRSTITIGKGTICMHRNRKPCISFFMVNMASSMDRGHVCPMTTTMTNDNVAQHRGHTSAAALVYRADLQRTSLILEIHVIVN